MTLLDELRKIIVAIPLDLNKLAEIIRKFRNVCATDIASHKRFGSDIVLLQDMCKLIDTLLELPTSESQMMCIRLVTQFIGNLTVGNSVNQENVHLHCFKTIKKLMVMGDGKLSLYCSMLFYNTLLGHPDVRYSLLEEPDIIREILKEESEFASFIYEELLLKHGELEQLYNNASSDQRLILFETIKENKSKETLSTKCIKFIIDTFKKQSDKILKIVSDYVNDIEPQEICLMLETLASLSSEHKYLEILQSDKSFFINCAFLLRSIHETGKSGDNYFTSVQRITSGLPDKQVQANPVFAFKVDLIRLLGNLCWKNADLQNLIRELECIQIILDCCNIDERNPFITQWSILAIRNLCENNQENQGFIAGLSQKGVVSSPVLNELGFTLHSEEGKDVKLVPLQR